MTDIEKIKKFKTGAKPITDNRAATFKNLMSFVLDGQQFSDTEIKSFDGKSAFAFNFSEDYAERFLARLFPRGKTGVIEVGVKVYGDDKEKKESEILDAYRQNDLGFILLEQGTNFIVGGAACLYFPQDPITKKVNIISLNPQTIYLGWDGLKLNQFAYDESVLDVATGELVPVPGKRWHYWDLEHHIVIENDEIVKTFKNPFSFVPFAWIPNYPKPHTHEGRSKILSLYDLDREYNFRACDFSNRIAENTKPHLAVYSDDVDIDKVDRGGNKKTKLGKDDAMEYLELKEGSEILNYLANLSDTMMRKTGIVESSGVVENQVSGLSLSVQYSDMMDLIGFMRIFWDKGLREINKAILAYKFGEAEYMTDPIYNEALNFDSKQRIEEYAIMIDKNLISHRDAIDELRGVENADEKFREILEEQKTIDLNEVKIIKPNKPNPPGLTKLERKNNPSAESNSYPSKY